MEQRRGRVSGGDSERRTDSRAAETSAEASCCLANAPRPPSAAPGPGSAPIEKRTGEARVHAEARLLRAHTRQRPAPRSHGALHDSLPLTPLRVIVIRRCSGGCKRSAVTRLVTKPPHGAPSPSPPPRPPRRCLSRRRQPRSRTRRRASSSPAGVAGSVERKNCQGQLCE